MIRSGSTIKGYIIVGDPYHKEKFKKMRFGVFIVAALLLRVLQVTSLVEIKIMNRLLKLLTESILIVQLMINQLVE